MVTLIAVIIALIAGICIGLAIGEFRKQNARIAALEAADKNKRLSYHAADEIENGLAALNYEIFDEEVRHERFMNAIAHFQAARNGRSVK